MTPSIYERTRLHQVLIAVALGLVIWGLLSLHGNKSSAAGIFVVNSLGDARDADLTDGICQTSVPGECTLRAAVQQANAGPPSPDLISFDDAKLVYPATILLTDAITVTDQLVVNGPGTNRMVIDGAGKNRHFFLDAPATIQNLTLVNGLSGDKGGSIRLDPQSQYGFPTYRMSLVAVNIHGSSAQSGGAIYARSNYGAQLIMTLRDVGISGNRATSGSGGAIEFDGNSQDTLEIANSTFNGNSAQQNGGAVANSSRGTVRIVDSTLSGNFAANFGGALHNSPFYYSTVTTVISDSTIVSNTAAVGGGINNNDWSGGQAIFQISGSIIAGNTSSGGTSTDDCSNSGYGADFTSLGRNLTVTGTTAGCVFSSVIGDLQVTPDEVFSQVVDPALADNGGPTATHALLIGSQAIDSGGDCTASSTDQRGTPRPMGTACDIGAYEAVIPALAVTKTVGVESSSCATSQAIEVGAGAGVYYCIKLQNTGNVTFTNIAISDPQLGINAALPVVLAPGRTETLLPGAANPVGAALGPVRVSKDFTNTATVAGYNVELAALGVASTVTTTSLAFVRPISVSLSLTQVGNDAAMTRTVTATLYHQGSSSGLLGRSIAFQVMGGTAEPAQSKLSNEMGQATFEYVSRAPQSQASSVLAGSKVDSPQVQDTPADTDLISVWVDGNGNLNHDPYEPYAEKSALTAVTLASFTAARDGGDVILRWTTAVERDNAGFNLYRASFSTGPYTKLNDQLIAAEGNGTGASYSYIDTPQTGESFFYILEDVDYNGAHTRHGPVESHGGFVPVAGLDYLYLPGVER